MSGPPRFNFPSWNYGYTLGPPTRSGNGDYTMFNSYGGGGGRGGGGGGFRPPFHRGGGGRGRMPYRGGGGGMRGHFQGKPHPEADAPSNDSAEQDDAAATAADDTDPAIKADPDAPADPAASAPSEEGGDGSQPAADAVAAEGQQQQQRPLSVILHGRNPIMFCNDQSKYRGLHMEWEQVSETGPPHDKTFTWSLKMGDMTTLGASNSKKNAKNKAAEDMVMKLDLLPRPQKRNFNQMNNFNFYNHQMGPPMPPPWMHHQMMKRGRFMRPPMGMRMPMRMQQHGPPGPGALEDSGFESDPSGNAEGAPSEGAPAAVRKEPAMIINPSQNNPVSKMYEYCKRKKLPEPLFETVAENVLETRKTQQGFTLKKTEFTMQCSVEGKKFIGQAMNKKQAKFKAAEAAWAELGGGVAQSSIDSLLQSHRNTSN